MSIQTFKFDRQSRLGKKRRHPDRLSLEAGNSFSKSGQVEKRDWGGVQDVPPGPA